MFPDRLWPTFGPSPLLGANGTEAMMALWADGGGDLVDYLKVGPFMGQERVATLPAHYPLMLHLDDTLSSHAPPSEDMLHRLGDWITLTGTPWISEHIGFSVADTDLDGALITQPSSALLPREQAFANIVRNACILAERLPVPLLLENIPLFPNMAHLHVCEPDFVSGVLAETGCDLLLDLAHARVSASMLGYDVYDYVGRLPLERTVELHLSGPRPHNEIEPRRQALVTENARSVAHLLSFGTHNLVDAHAPMREEDYALLEWVLARTQPKAISLEYFREPVALREQLERLSKLLGRRI
jgi:uncharacterized protein (UPF0276 family)